jgi:hypothetical protein
MALKVGRMGRWCISKNDGSADDASGFKAN